MGESNGKRKWSYDSGLGSPKPLWTGDGSSHAACYIVSSNP